MSEQPQLLTINEATDRLNARIVGGQISSATLRREIQRGRLPSVSIGRFVYVREDDLDTYLSGSVEATARSAPQAKSEKGSRPGAQRRGWTPRMAGGKG